MFCQYMAKGYTNADAYVAAGYSPSSIDNARTAACQMKRNPKVADRIEELLRENALSPEGVSRKRAWIEGQYLDLFRRAVEGDKLKEADSILFHIAQFHGEVIQKREIKAEIVQAPDAQELRGQLAAILGELTAIDGETVEEALPSPEEDPNG